MKTLILCGGKGTRAYPQSLEMPKPLMAVGDSPILLHLMGIYARQGFTDFVLAGGYRVDLLETFAETLPAGLERSRSSTPERTRGPRAGSSVCAGSLGLGDLLRHLRRRSRLDRPAGAARLPPLAHRGGDRDGGAAPLPLRHARVGRDRAGSRASSRSRGCPTTGSTPASS